MNGSWTYNRINAGFKVFAEEDLDEAEKFLAEIEK